MDAAQDGIDVIIPTTDPAHLDSLGRSVFSAALQDHQPVRIIVVCQGFDPAARDALDRTLAPIMAIEPAATLLVLHEPEPGSTRATLLKHGIAALGARYAAILECGAVIYPEAWRLLIDELSTSGTAIAEGGILHATTDRDGVVPYVAAKSPVPVDALPLHALVIDRLHVDLATLVADDDLATLARLRAGATVSTRLHTIVIGEH